MSNVEYPISLETARQHLRVGDDTSLDGMIEEYLGMAFGIADDFTNRTIETEFSSDTLPPAIKAAILLILGTLFDNESDALVGRSVSQLPLTAERLLMHWRIHPYSEPDKDSEDDEPEPADDVVAGRNYVRIVRIAKEKSE